MAETKNLCAQIDLALHTKVCEEREKAGQTTSQYITQLLMEYYDMKENGGKSDMANSGNRTMAFQISDSRSQRNSSSGSSGTWSGRASIWGANIRSGNSSWT